MAVATFCTTKVCFPATSQCRELMLNRVNL
jgi:hypothetical protein